MDEEKLIHDWLVQNLKKRLSREYKEIKDNLEGNNHEINGVFPDLILGNHGMVLAALEVETETSIGPDAAKRWKSIIDSGTKLFLMIPGHKVKDVTSLLWENAIADKASIGTYEISIRMP